MLFFELFINLKNPDMYHRFHKILSSTTVFNIDNNKKCLFHTKSAYYDVFFLGWLFLYVTSFWQLFLALYIYNSQFWHLSEFWAYILQFWLFSLQLWVSLWQVWLLFWLLSLHFEILTWFNSEFMPRKLTLFLKM